MNPEIKLKEYQLKKYGKCFQCGTDMIKDCKAICMNCGYKDTWSVTLPYQEDKHERKDTQRKYGQNTYNIKTIRKGDEYCRQRKKQM